MIERNAGLPPERRIEFRVGIHLGDVVEESDGDLMGDSVNIAARLEGISGSASRSSSPRLIVERASPVIFETIARPPQPAVRASAAANNRRPRSSSFEPTASHRCQMASPLIMRSTYTHAQRAGIPNTRVTTPHDHELRFSYCSECPKWRAAPQDLASHRQCLAPGPPLSR